MHLAETTRILRWRHANVVFALLALISAATSMAAPGPSGDITGFAAVLAVGAIALLAGHAWGILVVAASEVLILGKAWPIVSNAITSDAVSSWAGISAITATLTALPGLVLFIVTLPYMVEVIIGAKDSRIQRPVELASSMAAGFWLLQPVAAML